MRLQKNHGFTMVELMAVIVVLGVLAAVAAPKFFDYGDDAKQAACKGSLGAIRAAIANFKANEALKNGKAAYPTYKQLTTVGTVMEEEFPENPYNNYNGIKSVKNKWKANNPPVYKGKYGWVYDTATGKFWPNSKTKGINENSW